MATALYLSSDLRRASVVDEPLLDATTERHRIDLVVPSGRSIADPHAELARHAASTGLVLALAGGLPDRERLNLLGRAIAHGRGVWLHWPAESAVERVDDERL